MKLIHFQEYCLKSQAYSYLYTLDQNKALIKKKKSEILFLLLTSSTDTVRQGKCLLVSLIFKALAFWAVFKARDKFSDVNSK